MTYLTSNSTAANGFLRCEGEATGVIAFVGEIDLAAYGVIDAACFAGNEFDFVADLSSVSFMDCAGYGSLLAAREQLEAIGGSLTICTARGQPRRVLDLFDQLSNVHVCALAC